ncbi:MAG: HepT-like ribonuclease domain-containing protein [Candidatus Ranarchaeia archaeon]
MPLTEKRIKRYLGKINHIRTRYTQIQTWLGGVSITDFVKKPMPLLAVYKAYQEIIDALFDIIAMMCKDLKIPPRDDLYNLAQLGSVFEIELTEELKGLNTIRNQVTHRYNHGEDMDYVRLIVEGLPKISETIKEIEKWLVKRQ